MFPGCLAKPGLAENRGPPAPAGSGSRPFIRCSTAAHTQSQLCSAPPAGRRRRLLTGSGLFTQQGQARMRRGSTAHGPALRGQKPRRCGYRGAPAAACEQDVRKRACRAWNKGNSYVYAGIFDVRGQMRVRFEQIIYNSYKENAHGNRKCADQAAQRARHKCA